MHRLDWLRCGVNYNKNREEGYCRSVTSYNGMMKQDDWEVVANRSIDFS